MVCPTGEQGVFAEMNEYGKLIEGVTITPLKVFRDERGAVMHMLKKTDEHFDRFGEIYFSLVDTNAVKAWHLHKEMTLNYACIYGRIKLALFDQRPNSPTLNMVNTLHLEGYPDFGEYNLISIPPGVWNGFRAEVIVSNDYGINHAQVIPAIVANCATHPHDPEEIERRAPDEFPLRYDWGPYMVAG
jgi:dTDP-4-dehydrorhamnose 3,5-epimerase